MRPTKLVFLGLAALLLASAWPPSLVAQAPQTTAELLEQAARHEREQDFALAAEILAEAIRLDPSNEELFQRWDAARRQERMARRYRQPGIERRLVDLSLDRCLRIHGEVAAAIADHYVKPVPPRRLWEAGVSQMELALANKSFVRAAFGVPPGDDALDRYRAKLRPPLGEAPPGDRAALERKVRSFALAIQQDLGANATAVVLEFIHAACETFDPYGAYLDPPRLVLEKMAARSDVASIGLEVRQLRGQLIVASVAPDGPAGRAGVQLNELLVAIDDQPARHLSPEEATLRLFGEEGTVTTLRVQGIVDAQPRTLRLVRRRLQTGSITDARLLDEFAGIGYVRLSSFSATTPDELDAALANLSMAGLRGLLLDLRDNPGGNLEAAVRVADRFLGSGVVASTRGRSPGVEHVYEARPDHDLEVPLVVLVNAQTASAAEVLAGALQELGRATLVGAKTYGKNSVQYVFPLAAENGGVRLTAAYYWLPRDRPLPDDGLTPDVLANELPMGLDSGMPMSPLQLQQWQLDLALRTIRDLLDKRE